MSDTSQLYQEEVLNAADTCANCLRLIRVERVDPYRSSMHELESKLTRRREVTDVDWCDAGDRPTEAKGVWCECGVEGARDRIWEPDEVDRDRVRQLIQNLLRTLGRKRITVDRKRLAAHALQTFDECGDIDDALSRGIEQGIARAVTG